MARVLRGLPGYGSLAFALSGWFATAIFHLVLALLTKEAGPCVARVQGVSSGVRQI